MAPRWKVTATVAAAGVAVGLLGLGVARYYGAFGGGKRKRKTKSNDLRNLPSPDNDNDIALQPWEEEAESLPPVNEGIGDEPVGPHELAVGSGRPQEFLPSVGGPGLSAGLGEAQDWTILDPLSVPDLAPRDRGAPFAPIPTGLTTWPVLTKHSGRLQTSYLAEEGWHGYSGRAFSAKRQTSEGVARRHAGVDLFGRDQDVVVAPESGTVLAILPFHHGTWAVYLITDDDVVINLGEVEKYSWREFDIGPGDPVAEGQPVARIGVQSGGGTMLHYEMYDGAGVPQDELVHMIRNSEFQWLDDDPPHRLYDPTAYLLTTASSTYRRDTGEA
jgi:murein DD-endopeptidase MepM/ murein hydrolase activator NlpD